MHGERFSKDKATSWLLGLLLLTAGLQADEARAQGTYVASRTSSFTYYEPADGAKNGLLKSETIEPGNAQLCVVTSYGYDAYGNKVSATTANCTGASGRAVFTTRSSSTAYAALAAQPIVVNGTSYPGVGAVAGIFATSATNVLLPSAPNQSETRQFDPRFGIVTQLVGPNQLATNWTVDDFGRKTKELRADNTSTVSAYCKVSNGALDTSNTSNSRASSGDPLDCPSPQAGEAPIEAAMFVHSEPRDTSGNKMGPFVRVYSDRLGRQIRSVTESFDGTNQPAALRGTLIVKDTVYNPYGAKIIETQPYFLANGASTTADVNKVGATLINYDVLGRPVNIYTSDPNGAHGVQSFVGAGVSYGYGNYGSLTVALTSVSYAGLVTTTTNDKGQKRTEEKNPIGELVLVTDASQAKIAYQRDAFGNLLTTKDALQNTINLSYDTRGRKTQMKDPDTGTWNYDYDALGQLVWQQSPNQLAQGATVATTMVYDQLGRMTSRTEPDYISTWTYDSCTKGVGKLCATSTTNGVNRTLVYDGYGRPVNSLTTVTNGPAMATALVYDLATGRVASQTYPTGLQVGYVYTSNGRGFLQSLTLKTAANVAPLPATAGGTASGGATLNTDSALWTAQVVNAWGRTEQQAYGNGVIGNAAFEAVTGRVTDLTAGAGGVVLSQHYTWDSLSKLTGRNDDNGDRDINTGVSTGAVTETFAYDDSLNRLISYTVGAPAIPGTSRTVNLAYNALGMLLSKSDVGNYTYGAQNTAGVKPHALQSVIATTGGITNYGYDANGNLTSADAGKYSSISYTSFNLPDSQNGISGPAGTPKYTWRYDENHARIQETRTITGGTQAGTRTLWYLHPDNQGGLAFESEVNSPTTPSAGNPAVTSNRHFLSVGGQTIGVLVSTGALPPLNAGQTAPTALASIVLVKVEYWHKDHLGSLITTTDHLGSVTQRYAYDPFGKRRFVNGNYDAFGNVVVDWSPAVNWGTARGFTGHEGLDDVGLVNMNGRIFDPTLGVFLQGDPLIQDPSNLQNFNRYGYCYNNPLTCTDPSGEFIEWIVAAVVSIIVAREVPELRPFIGIAWSIALPGTGGALAELGLTGIAQAATSGFISGTMASGGNLRSGLQGAFSAAMFAGVGKIVGSAGLDAAGKVVDGSKFAGAVALHGVVGCVTSVAGGGKCGTGALSAAFSKAALPLTAGMRDGIERAIAHAVIGGTGSVLGGGTFANGAQTGAFSYLFNYCTTSTTGCFVQKGMNVLKIAGGSAGFAVGMATCGVTFGLGCAAAVESGNQVIEGATYFANAGAEEGFKPSKSILQSVFGESTGSHINTGAEVLTALQNAGAPMALTGFSLFRPDMSTRIQQMGTLQLGVTAGSTAGKLLSDPYYRDQIK